MGGFSVLTGEHLGNRFDDEHARDKLICSPCKAELDKETWDARGKMPKFGNDHERIGDGIRTFSGCLMRSSRVRLRRYLGHRGRADQDKAFAEGKSATEMAEQ